jgi:hypothetical protein
VNRGLFTPICLHVGVRGLAGGDHITYQHIVVDDEDGAGCVHAAPSGFVAIRAVKVAADRPNSTTVTASQCRKNG